MPEVRVFRDAKGNVSLFPWLEKVRKDDLSVWRKCAAWIKELKQQGFRLQRPIAAPLRDGIHELRPKSGHINYRMLYFFHDGMAVITHGLTKEDVVPDEDIEWAIKCRTLVTNNRDKFTADFPNDFWGTSDGKKK